MNARRVIDRLTEGEETTFEYELEFSVGDQLFKAALNVEASFEKEGIGHYEFWGQRGYDAGSLNLQELRYRCLAILDEEGNEVQMTPEISRAIDGAFESNREALEQRAYQEIE